jgi:hypothetical protein
VTDFGVPFIGKHSIGALVYCAGGFALELRAISLRGDIGRGTLELCAICVNGDCTEPHLHALPIAPIQRANSHGDQIIKQRVRPQGRAEPELNIRVASGQLVTRTGQIALQMHPRRKEIRDHQHTTCAALDAPVSPGRQVGLGELEEAALDNRVGSGSCDSGRELVQVVIGTLLAAAVSDQQHSSATRRHGQNRFLSLKLHRRA